MLRNRDVYPGSRIQKQQQKRGVNKFCCHIFFVATNFTKFKIILFLKCRGKKFGKFQKIIEIFTQKNSQKALKNMGLGSGIGFSGFQTHIFPCPGVKVAQRTQGCVHAWQMAMMMIIIII